VAADVTDAEALSEAIADAESRHGPVDCMVNNAGTMLLGRVATQDPAEWRRMLDVNVTGLMNGVRAVLPAMVRRKGGTIVNVGSVAGRKTFPNHAAYNATKFAVHAFSEGLREEIADRNVRVVTIAPGAVETELVDHTTSDRIRTTHLAWRESIGGAIAPGAVADAVLFAYGQPANVCVREIVLAPTRQAS
jgi:NADP-dependent 3-hydroxy acid dehydrogenase YdfG